jgi:F-type H+-transporting ATPase subunit beta
LNGELDHLPEVAFYMVGPIEEVAIKADSLAKS